MDISILNASTKFGSPNQLKFVKTASIKDLCERHSTNRHHRNTTSMHASINGLQDILEQLEEQNIVYSYLDSSNNWKMFYPTDEASEHGGLPKEVNETPPVNKQQRLSDNRKEFLQHKLLIANKYKSTLSNAITRGIDFDLSIKDVEQLMTEKYCYYTGVAFDSEENSITFDRVDHEIGYIPGNVVACTLKANHLKNALYEQTGSLFPDIKSLKNFVDTIYVSTIKDNDPLSVFLLEESA